MKADKKYRIKPLSWDERIDTFTCSSGFGELAVFVRDGKWWLHMDPEYWSAWESERGPYKLAFQGKRKAAQMVNVRILKMLEEVT